MNCQEARESFSMLLDGELGLTERVPLELHVNACEGCQRRLEYLRELRELEQRARPTTVTRDVMRFGSAKTWRPR